MTEEQQLKLQSFLDGELREKEARETASWMARDSEATALFNELRNTRRAFKDSESTVRLPESREFYWSKIQREIERLTPAAEPVKKRSFISRLRHVLVPIGAVALLLLAGFLAVEQSGIFSGSVIAPDSEMTVADSRAFTYHDYAHGTTLVWVSYPAER